MGSGAVAAEPGEVSEATSEDSGRQHSPPGIRTDDVGGARDPRDLFLWEPGRRPDAANRATQRQRPRRLPGASAEEIETTLTLPIETAVNSIEGIDELRANSNQGNTNVNINFMLEKDMDVAVQDVRDKIGPIVNQFGRDASAPVIQKSDPDSGAVLTIAIYGDRDFKELSEIVDEQIKQVLETTSGVAEDRSFPESGGARSRFSSMRTGCTPMASPWTRCAMRSSVRTSRFRAARSSPAPPRSRCERWDGSPTFPTSIASFSRKEMDRSSRSATLPESWTP